MTIDTSQTLRLYTSKKVTAGMILLFVCLGIGLSFIFDIWGLQPELSKDPWYTPFLGFACLLAYVWSIICLVKSLFRPNVLAIQIAPEGLTLYKQRLVRWSEIQTIQIMWLQYGTGFVFYRLTPNAPSLPYFGFGVRGMSVSHYGIDISFVRLHEILSAYHRQYKDSVSDSPTL
jgi:hypothetical protein